MNHQERGFSESVAATRRARGLTMTELAKRAGCSYSAVWGVEAGRSRPSLDLAIRIARALDASLDDLTRGER